MTINRVYKQKIVMAYFATTSSYCNINIQQVDRILTQTGSREAPHFIRISNNSAAILPEVTSSRAAITLILHKNTFWTYEGRKVIAQGSVEEKK